MLLADVSHWFGEDLQTSSTGDLQTVTGTDRGRQRVVRRLLTNPGGDIFEPTYGAGLRQHIGRILDIPKLEALCVAQMLLEDVVAKSPVPTVKITQPLPGTILVLATYTDQPTNTPVVLPFSVT